MQNDWKKANCKNIKDMTKEQLLSTLEEFYSKEKQEEYGVLGIKIELIK